MKLKQQQHRGSPVFREGTPGTVRQVNPQHWLVQVEGKMMDEIQTWLIKCSFTHCILAKRKVPRVGQIFAPWLHNFFRISVAAVESSSQHCAHQAWVRTQTYLETRPKPRPGGRNCYKLVTDTQQSLSMRWDFQRG